MTTSILHHDAPLTLKRRIYKNGPDLVALIVPLLIIIAFWVPRGLNIGFVGDGWFFYANPQRGIAAWASADRPFLPFAYLLGYALAPGYFAGFNLMLVIILILRSWLVYAIARQLGSLRSFAFAVAILTTTFPADTGYFYLGALNVYFAWDAYLLAVYYFIRYSKQRRVVFLFLMWCAQIINLGTYEAAYPLIVFTPLLLFVVRRHGARRWGASLFRWYLFPVLNIVRLIVVTLISSDALNYQAGLVTETPTFSLVLSNLAFVFQRHFYSGWFDGIGAIPAKLWVLALMMGGLAFAAYLWIAQRDEPTTATETLARYKWLPLIGIAIIGLSMAILLPTSVAATALRTYFVSVVGAALALAAVFWLITRRPFGVALLVAILVTVGSGQLLQQHERYAVTSIQKQQMIRSIAEQVPSLAPDTALIVLDETPDRELKRVAGTRWYFMTSVLMTYDVPGLAVALCYPDDTYGDADGYCFFDDNDIEVGLYPGFVWTRPYDHIVLARYTASREFILNLNLEPYASNASYQPLALVDTDSPLPVNIQRMFTD